MGSFFWICRNALRKMPFGGSTSRSMRLTPHSACLKTPSGLVPKSKAAAGWPHCWTFPSCRPRKTLCLSPLPTAKPLKGCVPGPAAAVCRLTSQASTVARPKDASHGPPKGVIRSSIKTFAFSSRS